MEIHPMKHGDRLIYVALSVLAVVASAWGAPGTGPAGKAPARPEGTVLRGEWAILADELQLSADQKASLEARLKAYQDSMAAWEGQYGRKLNEARQSRDANTVREITRARDQLSADRDADVQAILTPEQRSRWEGFQLYRGELLALRRANPTDEQKKQIRALCDGVGKEIAGSKDQKEIQAAKERLRRDATNLLTAQQQEALRNAAQSRPARSPSRSGT